MANWAFMGRGPGNLRANLAAKTLRSLRLRLGGHPPARGHGERAEAQRPRHGARQDRHRRARLSGMPWLCALTSETGVRAAGVLWAVAATLLASRTVTSWAGWQLRKLVWWRKSSHAVSGTTRSTTTVRMRFGVDVQPVGASPDSLVRLREDLARLREQLGAEVRAMRGDIVATEQALREQITTAETRIIELSERLATREREDAKWDGKAIPLLGYSVIVSSAPDWIANLHRSVVAALMVAPIGYLWWWWDRHRSDAQQRP